MKSFTFAFLLLAACAGPASAQAPAAAPAPAMPRFVVGSPVPEFKPVSWLKGEPVTVFEPDKTYLLECWATWCSPCIDAIPHVNALHNKFKDHGLVVIGVDVREATPDKAAEFVKKQGDAMAYRVAYDGGNDGNVSKLWLESAHRQAIPHTFIVQKGKLLWQGSPRDLTEDMIRAMLAGKFNAKDELMYSIGAFSDDLDKLVPAKQAAAAGDADKAVALLKQCAPNKRDKGSSAAGYYYFIARDMLVLPGLGAARDNAFALDCLAKAIAEDPEIATHPDFQLLKVRALYAQGKKDECLKILEDLDAKGLPTAYTGTCKQFLAAVKDGKPLPEHPAKPKAKGGDGK